MLTLKMNSYYALSFVIMITLVSMHTSYVGPITSLVATLLFITHKSSTNNSRNSLNVALQFSLIAFSSLYIGLQLLNIIEIPVYNVISPLLGLRGTTYPTFDWKIKQLIIGSSKFALSLFFLGMLYLVFSGNKEDLAVATTTLLVLLIYFLPEGLSYRVIDVLAPFMAYAIASIISNIANLITCKDKWR